MCLWCRFLLACRVRVTVGHSGLVLLCLCDVWALSNSLVCWLSSGTKTAAPGVVSLVTVQTDTAWTLMGCLCFVQAGAGGPWSWYENPAAPRAWRAEPGGGQSLPCCHVQPPAGWGHRPLQPQCTGRDRQHQEQLDRGKVSPRQGVESTVFVCFVFLPRKESLGLERGVSLPALSAFCSRVAGEREIAIANSCSPGSSKTHLLAPFPLSEFLR